MNRLSENKKPILLFDGVCNLCNQSVLAIIKRDPERKFLFASLQSEAGQRMVQKFNLPKEHFDTVVLIEDNRIHTRSDVPLRIVKRLGGWWAGLYAFVIVPKFIRDPVYDLIAKNRYRIWGKRDSCMVPVPELRERFLEA